MSNLFSEIFENAAIDPELYSKFSSVTVEQILCIKSRGLMRIDLSHNKPIRKALVYDLEKELEEAVFGPAGYSVEIHEDYHLSDRYDINYLLDHYYDSMLLEIKNYDRIIYSVMKKAKISVEDGVIKLVLPDTFAAKDKEQTILRIFDDTFNGRFHMNAETEVDYCESEESVYTIESRNRVMNKVAAFSREMEKNSASAEETSSGVAVENSDDEPFMTLDDVLDNAGKKSEKPAGLPEAERGSEGGAEAARKESSPKTAENKPSEPKTDKAEKKEWSGKWEKSRSSFGGKKGRKGGESWYGKSLKAPGAPDDVIMGNDFEGEVIAMENITDAIGDVVVHGQITAVEDRDTKGGSKIIKYTLTDFTDTVRMKFFQSQELGKELLGILKVGDFIRVKGVAAFDDFDKEIEVLRPVGIKKVDDFREKREDYNSLKRVELHAHTKMSDMDGCVSVKDLVGTAVRFGHKAIAITDNGGVQSFPDAAALDGKIKILYGCNAYIVDDTLNAVINEKGQDFDGSFVVFDLETTGVVPGKCKLIEFGAVKVEHGEITDRFSTFVDPHEPLTQEISGLTSITDDMLIGAPNIEEVLPQFLKFCEGCVLVAHNAKFDTNCIRAEAEKQGLPYDFTHTDTI
ncbi:MAG: PHP domain-containing protein, partial [Lachnospiraceae bacterium]|nr:PHP domain-containing protein [Lachnospiraceae bacterium]